MFFDNLVLLLRFGGVFNAVERAVMALKLANYERRNNRDANVGAARCDDSY